MKERKRSWKCCNPSVVLIGLLNGRVVLLQLKKGGVAKVKGEGEKEKECIRKKHVELSYDMVVFLPILIIFLPSIKMMNFSYRVDTFSYISTIFLHCKHDFLPLSDISYIVPAFSYAIEIISYLVMTHCLLTSV